ncbi:MAG: carbohydrate kinase family protein [Ignavibacteriaceae bacterium]
MKLLVIGHSVLDFINDGSSIRQNAGGIFYSISAINRIKSIEDEISLCSQFDDETYSHFLSEFEKIDKSYLTKVDKIPRVHLNVYKDKERHEKYENVTNNLFIDIKDINKFDGILINMITGFDITLDQLQNIRKNFSGLIYIDVHTLSRGLDKNYQRNFRLIPDFSEWTKCIDIVQVNELELYTLFDSKSEKDIIVKSFEYGVKAVCITKGELGAKLYTNDEKEIVSKFIAARKIINPNVIGCGDIFGASFFYNYIRNVNAIESLSIAASNAELFVENKFL